MLVTAGVLQPRRSRPPFSRADACRCWFDREGWCLRLLLPVLLLWAFLAAPHAVAGEDVQLWSGEELRLSAEVRNAPLVSGYLPRDPKAKYPGVWGAELPTDGVGKAEGARIIIDTEGRVQILYAFDQGEARVHRAYGFFEEKVLAEWRMPRAPDAKGAARRAEARKQFAAYWREQVRVLVAEEESGLSGVEYENGKVVRIYSSFFDYQYENGLPLHVSGFYADYERTREFCAFTYSPDSVVSLPDLDPNTSAPERMLIRVSPAPQRLPMDSELVRECTCVGNYSGSYLDPRTGQEVPQECRTGPNFNAADDLGWVVPEEPITYRGRALDVVIADLRDGTFLVKDRGRPTVIRFQGDPSELRSPYLIQRKDLYLVDARDMAKWLEEAYGRWLITSGQERVDLPLLDPAAIFTEFDRMVVERLEAGYTPEHTH